jgi:hypothetical protein
MSKRTVLTALYLGSLILSGCGSRDERVATRQNAVPGNYTAANVALNDLHGSELQDDTPDGSHDLNTQHGLLWSLDRGILATLTGACDTAFRLLETASNLVEKHRQEWTAGNISREIVASVINDTTRPYDGNTYVANEAEETNNVFGAFANFTVSWAMTATEAADARGSLLLPNTIQGGIIDLPASSHCLFWEVAEGQIDLGTVTVTADELVILPG